MVVVSWVVLPDNVMYGMPALTIVGTSVGPWPVNGSVTADDVLLHHLVGAVLASGREWRGSRR